MILAETANQMETGEVITGSTVITSPVRGDMNLIGVAWMKKNERMRIDLETRQCHELRVDNMKIMAQARVFLPGEPSNAVEFRRGMMIASIEGMEAGKVAGVVVSPDDGQAQCLILSHLPRKAIYQCIPVSWIERIQGAVISLNMPLEVILALPDWHAF